MSEVDSTGTFTYRRDGVDVTDPILNDSAAEYTPGISESRGGTSKFYHSDRLGTTTKITDSTATTTDSRQYDAFGLLVSSSGSTPTPFGFVGMQGYQEDPDTGLKLLGHRYYDPSTGRFLTRDPEMDGRNWYDYCDQAPVTTIDPDGYSGQNVYKRRYKTVVGAAIAASRNDYDISVAHHRERGGYIIATHHGYILNGVMEGEQGSLAPPKPPPHAVGFWHIHPNPQGTPAGGGYVYGDPNTFSNADINFAKFYKIMVFADGDKFIIEFDPRTGTIKKVAPHK